MSLHIFGAVVTAKGIAANNRGENEGNISTLQKLLWDNLVHTTVSSEAIRWAIRYYWQTHGFKVNRIWDDEKSDYIWQDSKWLCWNNPEVEGSEMNTFIDDDVLGFMLAEAATTEGNSTLDTLKEEKKKLDAELKDMSKEAQKTDAGKTLKEKTKELTQLIKSMSKGTCDKRRGVLEVARAISTIPYAGDLTFNAKAGEKGRTSLYGTEVHATRYQYGFALTPERLNVKTRAVHVIDAITNLGEVAGNHSRFLFDFSPESIILRITEDPAPRLLYCFNEDENGNISVPELIRRVKNGDIGADELYIGGLISEEAGFKGKGFEGAFLSGGVKEAVANFKEAMNKRLNMESREGE